VNDVAIHFPVNDVVILITKALETDNFLEAWCKAGARLKCEELLKDAEQIEWAEADR
jgi:hypothetical protein